MLIYYISIRSYSAVYLGLGCRAWFILVADSYFPGMHGAQTLMANRDVRFYSRGFQTSLSSEPPGGLVIDSGLGVITPPIPSSLPPQRFPFMGLG